MYDIYGVEINKFNVEYNKWFDTLHPEDKNNAENHILSAINGEYEFSIEFRIIKPNGEIRYIQSASITNRNDDGNAIRMIGINIDITDRKNIEIAFQESELRLKTIIDVSPVPLALNDENAKITFLNKAFINTYGYDISDIPTLDIWWQLAYPDPNYRNEVVDKWQKELANSKLNHSAFNSLEVQIRCKNGMDKTVIASASSITKDFKKEHLVVLYDITELKIKELELIFAKEKAEESDLLKTAFLQNMSHEIRTPLNGIIGFSDLLNDDDITKEEIKEYTSIIQNSSDRLLETVTSIIDISRIETGQISIQNNNFDLFSLFENLRNTFTPSAQKKNLILTVNLPFNFKPLIIYSDETKINKILSNLINNALKFTYSGEIEIGFTIENDLILFFVKDTGPGIVKELFTKIFDRFVQAEISISRGYEGIGLGLSICKGLVEALGGRIWLDSEIGKGSIFYFTINKVTKIGNSIINGIENEKLKINEKIKILIADDDYPSFYFLKKTLSKMNFEILHAENGVEALEIIEQNTDIRLIFMDMKMPIMDGYNATKLIKQIRPQIPIIAQTAYTNFDEIAKLKAIGCADYLAKPLTTEKIFGILEEFHLD